jgi:hypothetical protein
VRAANWELDAPLPLTRHDLDALGFERTVPVRRTASESSPSPASAGSGLF